MFSGFDFSALDDPGFKEDAVREDIIAPILKRAGYQAAGVLRMARSKPLLHPYVMIGSKKHPVNIVPDYTLYEGPTPLMVVEAKSPSEAVVGSAHVEQAFSYAIHPDVRCRHYALCNGRQLVFYEVGVGVPLFEIRCQEVADRWAEVERYLLPRYLKLPDLRRFVPDLGVQLQKLGVAAGDDILHMECFVQLLTKSYDGFYTAAAMHTLGGLECLASYDFGDEVLDAIAAAVPPPQAAQIRSALARMPCTINIDTKLRATWHGKLGEAVQGPHEEFIPIVVTDVVRLEYDPLSTVGIEDPQAVAAGVKRLR